MELEVPDVEMATSSRQGSESDSATPGTQTPRHDPPNDARAGALSRADLAAAEAAIDFGSLKRELLSCEPSRLDGTKPQIGGQHYARELAQVRLELIMGKLARGTRNGYSRAWRQWALFCKARHRDPYLLGDDPKEEEELLLEFVAHWFKWFQRTEGTIKSKLMAVRYQHVAQGFQDPLKAKPRLFLALGGVKRATPTKPRGLPLTLPMMKWAQWRYQHAADDEFVVFAAGVLAWFFLLRAGECVAVDGQPWQAGRALTGGDVVARRGGEVLALFADADEVVVNIRGSKGDQYNAGCIRNHYRTGHVLCPVETMAEMQRRFPDRWKDGANSGLFCKGSGRMATRTDLGRLAKTAAGACGADPVA